MIERIPQPIEPESEGGDLEGVAEKIEQEKRETEAFIDQRGGTSLAENDPRREELRGTIEKILSEANSLPKQEESSPELPASLEKVSKDDVRPLDATDIDLDKTAENVVFGTESDEEGEIFKSAGIEIIDPNSSPERGKDTPEGLRPATDINLQPEIDPDWNDGEGVEIIRAKDDMETGGFGGESLTNSQRDVMDVEKATEEAGKFGITPGSVHYGRRSYNDEQ